MIGDQREEHGSRRAMTSPASSLTSVRAENVCASDMLASQLNPSGVGSRGFSRDGLMIVPRPAASACRRAVMSRRGAARNAQESPEAVYVYSRADKPMTRLIDDMVRPNGIIGTPDGKKLSVVDIRGRKTFAYDIAAEGTLTSPSGEQLESIAVPECRPMSASAARTRQGQEDAVHHRLHRALRGEDARPRSARIRHRRADAPARVARCARLLRILD
jgi:hypothetical protein